MVNTFKHDIIVHNSWHQLVYNACWFVEIFTKTVLYIVLFCLVIQTKNEIILNFQINKLYLKRKDKTIIKSLFRLTTVDCCVLFLTVLGGDLR